MTLTLYVSVEASCYWILKHETLIASILSIFQFGCISNFSMEANRGQNAIQQLLAAEQEAQRIVNEARKGILVCY